MAHRARSLGSALILALLLAATLATAGAAEVAPGGARGGWLSVEYRALLDLRQPSQSGETVADLLAEASVSDEARRVRALDLLEPMLEPFAFVLEDAIDTIEPAAEPPLVEIAALWPRGGAEPAWVELLRARRFVVLGDGAGKLRVFLPWEDDAPSSRWTAPTGDTQGAARAAWQRHYGVLRHVVAAELARQRAAGKTAPSVAISVHAYRHLIAESRFVLGATPYAITLTSAAPDGARPPLDLTAWRDFTARGLVLEGARLTSEGRVVLFGSERPGGARLLGEPLALSDFAVAHRAIFHGGRGAPYMSLDRSLVTHRFAVNHGGRLRDTRLGLVTMLCDVRFKTFSQGIDPWTGRDDRERARRDVPGFRTHVERFADDPRSLSASGQQVRFWFYPDAVDLTLAPQGDVVVFRRARMSAASERVASGAAAPLPPWTADTVAQINADYEKLARLYPELDGLDHVVRLLALFTWLREIDRGGLPVPDLDALLAVEIPPVPTPETFPQQLAFNALPQPGTGKPVAVYGQAKVGHALDRLEPAGEPALPAPVRARRALAALDRTKPEHQQAAAQLEAALSSNVGVSDLDRVTAQAERLVMHRLVLATLGDEGKTTLGARVRAGENLRVFSTGIGGIDLSMGDALRRAAGDAGRLAWSGDAGSSMLAVAGAAPSGAATAPRARPVPQPEWRADTPGLVHAPLPAHGWPAAPAASGAASVTGAEHGALLVQRGRAASVSWTHALSGARGLRPESRRAIRTGADLARIERLVEGRPLAFRLVQRGATLAIADPSAALPAATAERARRAILGIDAAPAAARSSDAMPADLALLSITPGIGDEPAVEVFVTRAGTSAPVTFTRADARRVVLGPEVELPNVAPISAIASPAVAIGAARHVLVVEDGARVVPPWDRAAEARAGEETAIGFARGLASWWARAGAAPSVAVALDDDTSVARWSAAPRAGRALLLAPEDAFPPAAGISRAEVIEAWREAGGEAVAALGDAKEVPPIVVVVSGEASAALGARLGALARDPRLRGKLLAVHPIATPLRADLAARLLEAGSLAGVGLAESRSDAAADVRLDLATFQRGIAGTLAGDAKRIEAVPGPFLWFF